MESSGPSPLEVDYFLGTELRPNGNPASLHPCRKRASMSDAPMGGTTLNSVDKECLNEIFIDEGVSGDHCDAFPRHFG
jgi:hypothetical protein